MSGIISTETIQMKTGRRQFPITLGLSEIIDRKEIMKEVRKDLEKNDIEKPKQFFDLVINDDYIKIKDFLKYNLDFDVNIIDQDSKMNAVLLAAYHGHNKVLELLMSKGADLNVQNECGETALMISIFRYELNSHSRHSTVCFLIMNTDLNIQDNTNNSALMCAAIQGNGIVTNLLLNKSVIFNIPLELNLQNKIGKTALMEAISRDYTEIAQLLIDKDVDVNLKDQDGKTALVYAFSNGHNDIASLLMNHGAEVPLNYLHKIGFKNLIKYGIRKLKEVFA